MVNLMYESRRPQIGDLLIVTCPKNNYNEKCPCNTENIKHAGIVREIEGSSWGDQRHVFIMWSSKPPIGYREEYGYSGINIHNILSEFTIIRDGKSIK